MILAILAAIVLVVVALVGWCVWRFCKKKRPKGNEKGAGKIYKPGVKIHQL